MKVLLLKDVYKLGHAGDVKKVADGYGRNYLIPQGLAALATGAVVFMVVVLECDGRAESDSRPAVSPSRDVGVHHARAWMSDRLRALGSRCVCDCRCFRRAQPTGGRLGPHEAGVPGLGAGSLQSERESGTSVPGEAIAR